MGIDRISKKFSSLKKENKSALITFHMAFDPDRETSYNILERLPKLGVDIIELGMPFSDPMADGPIIQDAAKRALKSGYKLKDIISMVSSFREKNKDTPVILMGYYNPILSYGSKKFTEDASKAGVDGCIIVDLPLGQNNNLEEFAKNNDISLIKLITPNTTEDRLKLLSKHASGFVYYVSTTAVTGTKSATTESIEKAIKRAKKYIDLPIVVGFGIKNAEMVQKVAKISEGVVVGSALIKKIHEGQESSSDKQSSNLIMDEFVQSLANAKNK